MYYYKILSSRVTVERITVLYASTPGITDLSVHQFLHLSTDFRNFPKSDAKDMKII